MPLFGPPNIDKLKAQGDVKGLIKALEHKEIPTRYQAAKALGELGEQKQDAQAIAPLIQVLTRKDTPLLEVAISALGKICLPLKDARAIPALLEMLKAYEADVRTQAIYVLGDLCPAVSQLELSEKAAQAILPLLQDRTYHVRHNAARTLGKIGAQGSGNQAVPGLINLLQTGDDFDKEAAAGALGCFADDRVYQPLVKALQDRSERGRGAAECALGQIKIPLRDPQVLDAITADLLSSSAIVRQAAVKLLKQANWQPGNDALGAAYWVAEGSYWRCKAIGAPAVEPLIRALQGNYATFPSQIIAALEKIGDGHAMEGLIEALRVPDSTDTRESAARALRTIAVKNCDPRPIKPLIARLMDRDQRVRKVAIEALGQISHATGDQSAIQPMLNMLDYDYDDKEAVAEELGKTGTAVLEDLFGRLDARSEDTRRAVVVGLQAMLLYAAQLSPAEVQKIVTALTAALRDSPGVSIPAAIALGKVCRATRHIRPENVIDPLIGLLERGEEHQARAAAEALVDVVKTTTEPEHRQHVIVCLVPLLKHSTTGVRSAAAKALSDLGWQPGEDESTAWYWVSKQDWQRCLEIGAPVIQPLITVLLQECWSGHSEGLREMVAETLVKLYHSGKLTPAEKSLILGQRSVIERKKKESVDHDDWGSSTCANDHTDINRGYIYEGVDFPL